MLSLFKVFVLDETLLVALVVLAVDLLVLIHFLQVFILFKILEDIDKLLCGGIIINCIFNSSLFNFVDLLFFVFFINE